MSSAPRQTPQVFVRTLPVRLLYKGVEALLLRRPDNGGRTGPPLPGGSGARAHGGRFHSPWPVGWAHGECPDTPTRPGIGSDPDSHRGKRGTVVGAQGLRQGYSGNTHSNQGTAELVFMREIAQQCRMKRLWVSMRVSAWQRWSLSSQCPAALRPDPACGRGGLPFAWRSSGQAARAWSSSGASPGCQIGY